jgi:hypothetical protein
MERGILAVQTEAIAGADDAFNAWYDEVHVPEILTTPGFASCRRYRVRQSPLASQRDATAWTTYFAIYEISGGVVSAHTELLQRVAAGELTPSNLVAPRPYRSQLFEQIAEISR